MKTKRKASVFSHLVLRVIIFTVILWLILMSLLTWAVAKDFYHKLQIRTEHWAYYANHISSNGNDPLLAHAHALSYNRLVLQRDEYVSPIFYDLLGRKYKHGSNDWFQGNWELMFGFQAAIQIDNEELGLSLRSGDYIFFSDGEGKSYYIDFSQIEGGREFVDRNISDDPRGDYFTPTLSNPTTYTGYLDGYQFYPTTICSNGIQHSFPTSDKNQTLVTITSPKNTNHLYLNYDPGKPFKWQGETYENAAKLLDEEELETGFKLFGSVISVSSISKTGTVTAVVYCKPLVQALVQTWHIWLITGIAVAVFIISFRRWVRRRIKEPLDFANHQYTFNSRTQEISLNTRIRELDLLGEHFQEAQLDRLEAHNRIQQLETALNYAKEAEENRRRLISALAHELKTPLAVIHSYTEGLQEGIAEDKKSHYLSILLEESEKMDSMVKEMLDYSRLEAGKVMLDTGRFSLAEIASQIFDRLKLSAQQRDLNVIFAQMEDFTVVADKNRIRQVITNLADNAIKYTTKGGNIRVLVYKKYGSAWFTLENDCEPLPQEALEHIWDSFYRVDTARSSNGTGLGLAIVKSIVTLHRGSCYVQNTPTGVRFSISIPM